MIFIRDRRIHRPIFRFYRYIGIGQNGRYYRPQCELTKRCYIPHASRQLAQESTTKQVETVILQQRYQVRFHKQTDKINRGQTKQKHQREVSSCSKPPRAGVVYESTPVVLPEVFTARKV